jgi:hypothetical protein
MKNTHGGQRKGAGRHRRPEPKAKAIWCGQLTEEERERIISKLTPDERREALLKAAKEKQ